MLHRGLPTVARLHALLTRLLVVVVLPVLFLLTVFIILVFLIAFILFLRLLLHWVNILLEYAVVEKLASDVDIELFHLLAESQFSVCSRKSDHGLERTDSDRHTHL